MLLFEFDMAAQGCLYCLSMNSKQDYLVSAFYKFVTLKKEDLPALKSSIENKATELHIRGLFLLGTEGVNSTISGPHEGCVEFRNFIAKETIIGDVINKDSI